MSESGPNDPNNPKKNVQLQIQLDEAIAQGTYCNLALLNHNETEFVFDFAYVQPQGPKAKVKARIQMHPKQAKRLLQVLGHRMQQYEARFGTIDVTPPDGTSSAVH